MTRDEILAHYNVNDAGVITSLGKFEREMLYVPYFWSHGLEGFYSEDTGSVYFFEIGPEDRTLFPEIGNIYGLALEESDTGFVYCVEYDTENEYRAAVARCEETESPEME